jgi:hypothetical protein
VQPYQDAKRVSARPKHCLPNRKLTKMGGIAPAHFFRPHLRKFLRDMTRIASDVLTAKGDVGRGISGERSAFLHSRRNRKVEQHRGLG